MSHNARLERLEVSIAPERTPELDAAIERGIAELERTFPDEWEKILDDIVAQSRTNTDIGQ
jgi:hypothetical protein